MVLVLDIGNTRIKWAVLNEHELGAQRAEVYAGWDGAQLREKILDAAGPVQRMLVANVGGEEIARLVHETVQAVYGFAPEFVRTAATAAGVRNAYPDYRKLGVDRWVSLIAAHAMERRATCVVSVGTAMTIDALDAQGRHLGGVIVPGPDLMMSSLMHNTSDIAAHAQSGEYGTRLFADNTLGAVFQGSVHALAALIERAMATMTAQLGEAPLLLLTGGAHERLASLIHAPMRVVPDLVLRGLAVLARES